MTVIEMTKRPHVELADLLPGVECGDEILIQRDGTVVARIQPVARPRLTHEMFAFRRAMKSPVYPGNSVLEMRQEERF